ncbi:ABC transporter ATP-binding protein [Bacillus aquiflavi]|uniref:Carnitine transport ATP-binding protein OpuCA n=1 Tax=Bacillus aquiflavi TaxID=2672567 RepID=A0A6B3W3I2_9BACI|nr:ABC transporter ATP-binding protein [Bacillus aquiflavi]MBA4538697.1 ABC transporter ATP-binding protein [Bacillus aquiflavi]NEY83057.1 ABC transporter ATP-binding protein [Bacillus aquiflavi]UAC47374.1 ABC transporter ATP-binding protein [Bacillus aquiflavi]
MAFIKLQELTKTFPHAAKSAVKDFDLEIKKGEIITLLGPSGCGKTTTLRMIAGFEKPTSGEIHFGSETIFKQDYSLPPEKRGIGMVFQDYALFPHLTVVKNVMFGLLKWNNKEKKKRAIEVLELVGLAQYANRYPHELSGGQQQRVALARALAPEPKVILMDEPFSNLDANMREKMRYDVKRILKSTNTTAIIVTHDQKDAFAVSDRVVVMKDGVIEQIDTPMEMYRCPKNCFVAQFLGKTNLLTGKMANDLKHVYTHIGKVCLPTKSEQLIDEVTLSVRPEGCRLVENGKYVAEVEDVIYSGEYQEVTVKINTEQGGKQSIFIHVPIEQQVKKGQVVSFDIKPELVSLVEK